MTTERSTQGPAALTSACTAAAALQVFLREVFWQAAAALPYMLHLMSSTWCVGRLLFQFARLCCCAHALTDRVCGVTRLHQLRPGLGLKLCSSSSKLDVLDMLASQLYGGAQVVPSRRQCGLPKHVPALCAPAKFLTPVVSGLTVSWLPCD